jgi:polysaccharide deacetylase family protein (PEP-CTERM system associated)
MSEPTGDFPRLAAMSIDVEDWFHVENVRRAVPRHTWRDQQFRVEKAMDRMLELMADCDVRATCFVLGCVAERAPDLVRRIADAGHEVASHGYWHELLYDMTPAEFRVDVEESKQLLEDISGQQVRGYRAPSFSLTDWALPILQEVGFEYDSSLFPTTLAHDRYGKPSSLNGGGDPMLRRQGLTEVSMSCLTLGPHALPWAGGGYFRLIPYPVFRLGVRRILRSGKPYVFYVHPWELDVAQPRLGGLRRSERIRHYLNLDKTESRWISLLRDFRWMTIAELLASVEGIGNDVGPIGASHDRRLGGRVVEA